MRIISLSIAIAGLLFAGLALTQAPPPPGPAANAEGAAVFQRECASCHVNPPADSRAPTREALGGRTADSIVAALTDGAMRLQGARLSVAERRSVSAFLTAATTRGHQLLWLAEVGCALQDCRHASPIPTRDSTGTAGAVSCDEYSISNCRTEWIDRRTGSEPESQMGFWY